MLRRIRGRKPQTLGKSDTRSSEAGDTLVEVLFAIVILGITAIALLTAFGTSIEASAEHQHLAAQDAALRAATDEVLAQIQDSADNAFGAPPPTRRPSPTWPDPSRCRTGHRRAVLERLGVVLHVHGRHQPTAVDYHPHQ